MCYKNFCIYYEENFQNDVIGILKKGSNKNKFVIYYY